MISTTAFPIQEDDAALDFQWQTESDILMAARDAMLKAAGVTARDLTGKRNAWVAEAAIWLDAANGPLERYRRALGRRFGTCNLDYLRRKHGDHPTVRRAIAAAHALVSVTARDVSGYEKVLAAERSLATATRGPLARHAQALRSTFGTADLYEAGLVKMERWGMRPR
jgi:hypothetical protein